MKKSLLFTLLVLLFSFAHAQTHWQPVDPVGSTGMNATLMGYVEIDGEEQRSADLEVGIFHGEVCRGTALLLYNSNSDRYLLFCSFFGLSGEEDTFRIYDHAIQEELDVSCPQTITYSDNAMIGITNLYQISFLSNHFTIGATANPTAGGTVTGGGVYEREGTATLTATANTGYSFSNWTKGDEVVSTSSSFSFTVTKATSGDYVANFTPSPYEITVVANPTSGGTVSGGGTHYFDTQVTLTAIPATGYHFVSWIVGNTVMSEEESYTFTVSGDADYVANFELNHYDISVSANPTAGGTVAGEGRYDHFSSCTLTATPAEGYHFVRWTKDDEEVSTDSTYTFEVSEGGEYVAEFEINNYDITAVADPVEGGVIIGAGNYNHFQTCELRARANVGYTFVNWTKGEEVVSTDTVFSFMVESAADYVAHFSLNSYEITVEATPTAGGEVSGAGTYYHFSTCELTATPATGYHFLYWTLDGVEVSDLTTYQFEVSGPAHYVANFEINSYEIKANVEPLAGGSVEGTGVYNHFQTCELTAIPATGYHFEAWTEDGVLIDTTQSISFTVTREITYTANFGINRYVIGVTANNDNFGTVEGGGTYNHFDTCTLVAIPVTGYHFVNWTLEGEEVSTLSTFKFEVTGAANYVGNFEINRYDITVVADPTAGGVVTGTGVYEHFSTCEITAAANTGYYFVNWTLEGAEVSDQETYSFEVTEGGEYVANFQRFSYEITAIVEPLEGGSVSGTGTHYHFDTCRLVATPSIGYHFVNWTVGGTEVSTSANYNFEVSQAVALVANFEINHYVITVTANDTLFGTVTGTDTYDHFDTCTLVATPATGYHFVNWTLEGEEVSTSATYKFEVTGEANYVGNFEINSYEITAAILPTASGTVTGAGTYHHFDTCTLVATPATGYHFVNWKLNDVEVSTESSISFMVEEACDYTANFQINSYVIAVSANDDNFGTVEGGGTYNHFDTCTLVATPAVGYHLVNWTLEDVEVSTSETYKFEVTRGGSYVGNFQINSYDITVDIVPQVGGTVTGDGTYNHFDTCTLVATPATGYHFVNWTLAGAEVSTDSIISFMVEEARNYEANFEINSYEITVSVNNVLFGTVTGADTYHHFDTCTLVAIPSTGYHFMNWTLGNDVVSTSTTYRFEVTGTASYVANFEINHYEIVVTANDTLFGTVTGTDTYDHFDTCTMVATPATGYHFVNWTLDGEEVSTSETYKFEVTGSASYVGNFEINSYDITVAIVPENGGTVTGVATYHHFDSCTLVATPATGYHFVNWKLNDVEVSTNPRISFMVEEARDYTANFEINRYVISVTSNNEQYGTVTGGGTYNHFDTCTMVATPAVGYHFVNWTLNGVAFSTSTTYQFEVIGEGSFVGNFAINSYEITAVANPTEGGEVTGTGTYNHFETCTLTAIPAEGYHFVNWTLAGTEVSTDSIISFMVEEARDYVANFQINSYVIGATPNDAQFGSVTGGGTYNHFETCTLVATPATGYHFVNWTLAGVEVSDLATYQFEVTGAANFVANFAINNYTITVVADPTVGGTVEGEGTYDHFDTCTLVATPATGYHFVNWTLEGEEVSTSATYKFEVTGEADFVGNFELNSYEITAAILPTASGTVTGAGTYHHFDTCTLVATPATGYHFVNWKLNDVEVSTESNISFMVEEARDYTANFEINHYVINVTSNNEQFGTVTGGGTYNHFDTCTMVATPATGYHFVNWTLNGVAFSTSTTYQFEVIGEGSFVGNFAINSYEISAVANPTEGGEVTGTGTYNHFETCTLTAIPAEGYHFVNWTLGGTEVSTDSIISFMVEEARDYVANFQINSYVIGATPNDAQFGSVTGAGTYNHFETCTLVATPSTGYHFVNWTLEGVEVSTSATYQFQVTGAANFVANFQINSYEITAVANPAAGGTVEGEGTYNHFATCTLVATPATGYYFVNWTLNGTEVSTSGTYSFVVSAGGDYVANFQLYSYEITAEADPTEGGTIEGAGTYNHFETCTLTATANTGYTFENWTLDDNEVSSDLSISFTVEGAANYVAHFTLNSYEITAVANPVEGGTVEGAGTYNHFDTCTLVATPATGYYFANWTLNGTEVSTSETYSFEVTDDGDYIANFLVYSFEITAEADPADGGTIEGTGTYYLNDTCTLTATANVGYTFMNWTLDGEVVSSNPSINFIVAGSANYVAHFSLNSYEITALSNPAEGGIVSGTGTYNHFASCTLIATPSTGYHFVNWMLGGDIVSNSATYHFVVTGPANFVANFELNSYVIAASVDPTGSGTIEGAGTYAHGQNVTLRVTPNAGFEFVNWTENGVTVSEEMSITFVATENRSLVAHLINITDVNENDEAVINVYPNPVVDKLRVESDRVVESFEVYSLTGVRVLNKDVFSESFEIQVESLSAGTYFIRMTSDKVVQVRKFVKE